MTYDPDIHHRHSIRLREYDYTTYGAYFVTICVQGRECLFGEIVDGEMRLHDAGSMIEATWNELNAHYPHVDIDTHVVMPNHFHGIILIVGAAPCGRPDVEFAAPRGRPNNRDPVGAGPRACPHVVPTDLGGHPQGGAPTLSLCDVVHRFKSMTTARYRHGVEQSNWPPFPGRLWQRNYYERIIRDEAELNATRKYIGENPMKWAEDEENPNNNP